LDGLLDLYQASGAVANVVMEFPGSGAYVTSLIPPAESDRIVMACTRAGRDLLWDGGGLLSFSGHFLSHVFEGKTIGESFERARQSIRRASGTLRQAPQIDDSGDGLATKDDGDLALLSYFGPAFVTGDDTPFIGRVIPDTLITGTNEVLL
ncbi:MAG: hypothetical protein GWN79_03740, partial [Actinobacteria bacterium]|nr:hypothetical protein [Actinomycetota bacterium]NIU18249.1 hypothetical protein [Actinomycetota bacterium]NIU64940.1 hypothetical protein [Actinomycetota bacterium]NIW26751.1 hypothetical protein [Actinomycetota bacterium]